MRGAQTLNLALLLTAVCAATAIMAWRAQGRQQAPPSSHASDELRFTTTADGTRALIDATGVAVPLGNYQRVLGGSIVSRAILGELVAKERIAGVIVHGTDEAIDAHRYVGIPRIGGMDELEAVLSLSPDLIIINSLGSVAHVERLREAGMRIFVLGDMRGVDSFVRDIQQISALLGREERGIQVAQRFSRRMRNVAADIPTGSRKRAMYLSAYGTQLFGGTTGTSYHDLLHYAGLRDAAESRFSGWPQFTAEHVLEIDPPIIVSPTGVPARLCKDGPLTGLQACADGRAGFVELPMSWLEDPSFVMLEVVESIREAVYGPEDSGL